MALNAGLVHALVPLVLCITQFPEEVCPSDPTTPCNQGYAVGRCSTQRWSPPDSVRYSGIDPASPESCASAPITPAYPQLETPLKQSYKKPILARPQHKPPTQNPSGCSYVYGFEPPCTRSQEPFRWPLPSPEPPCYSPSPKPVQPSPIQTDYTTFEVACSVKNSPAWNHPMDPYCPQNTPDYSCQQINPFCNPHPPLTETNSKTIPHSSPPLYHAPVEQICPSNPAPICCPSFEPICPKTDTSFYYNCPSLETTSLFCPPIEPSPVRNEFYPQIPIEYPQSNHSPVPPTESLCYPKRESFDPRKPSQEQCLCSQSPFVYRLCPNPYYQKQA